MDAKYDHLVKIVGAYEVKKLLMGGRMDPSGAFTKGVGLTEEQADALVSLTLMVEVAEWKETERQLRAFIKERRPDML